MTRRSRRRLQRLLVAAGLTSLLVGLAIWAVYREGPASTVRVPQLSPAAEAGRGAFQRSCASCHGDVGQGTTSGPPLVHVIYRPGHHPDEAFEQAARNGSRAHHWRFGDMPPQPTVTTDEVRTITRYVRELQQANGIE